MSTSKTNMITLFDTLNDPLKRKIGSYLDDQSLSAFLITNQAHSKLYDSTPIISQRKASKKLLFYVLNINCERKKHLVEMISFESKLQSETQSIILMRTTAEEFFYNTTQRKKLWMHVSPIEAAAKCGDFHIVRLMFDSLSARLKVQALEQLKAVRASRTIQSEAGSYITSLVELRNAYQAFVEPYDALLRAKNFNELERLCGLLGDAQNNLSAFLLQVFCSPGRHVPLPHFRWEPPRNCVLNFGARLNIASIGGSTKCALFKGKGSVAYARHAWARLGWERFDAAAMDKLYEVLPSELDNIIDSPVLESDQASEHPERRRLEPSK